MILIDFGSPQNVSTLTTLETFTLFEGFKTLLFTVVNLDSSNSVTMILETSQDGIHPDDDKTYLVSAGPGKQASNEVGPCPLRRWWRISAQTQSPTFPIVAVKWQISGSM